ncbi:MAG: hypothetical protein A3J08_02660 [Candidatus Lloydbacteria bacterium RIFCSPLOWO2_02_FULL_51_11]|nr:MAG: hypothetical protein A3J08_02660 [Candidatus Lloydbacteria bacterium RIFCSPLOWO2_02_FULL_51_11]
MSQEQYQKKTGAIYGTLFSNYGDKLFNDSVELFFKRHKRWGIDTEWFQGKSCLDAGCGGGRFMVALSRLGAREVKGIDISDGAVNLANERLRERGFPNAEAAVASVLKIPFADNRFDYVVSSGVIHHTPTPHVAFKELVRVLKPRGKLFLSIYGTGGLKWLTNDIFRYSICTVVPFTVMEQIFKAVGVPPNKRYNILDNLYVTHCYRFTEAEVRRWLAHAGFENVRRLKFERYDYETLLSRIIHGEGWLQFYAEKG